jgi:hypothetical protein
MTLQKGWINRQLARVERDVQNWPSWMRREVEMQTTPAQEPSRSPNVGQQQDTDQSSAKTTERT